MRLMEEMILAEGEVLPGNILKVGKFLNQQIDCSLLRAIGEEIVRLYKDSGVTKVLTIEASGIAMAASASLALNVPMVFAKKSKSSNVSGDLYTAVVHSYTHGTDYTIVVCADYINPDDKILIVDDFLACGNAIQGLREIISAGGAELVGVVAAIEKCFQGGGDTLRAEGIRVDSLACVESMDDCRITFRK